MAIPDVMREQDGQDGSENVEPAAQPSLEYTTLDELLVAYRVASTSIRFGKSVVDARERTGSERTTGGVQDEPSPEPEDGQTKLADRLDIGVVLSAGRNVLGFGNRQNGPWRNRDY
jgi:hypothetical protein